MYHLIQNHMRNKMKAILFLQAMIGWVIFSRDESKKYKGKFVLYFDMAAFIGVVSDDVAMHSNQNSMVDNNIRI